MPLDPNVDEIAGALHVSLGVLVRRMRQVPTGIDLTMPETSALARLDRGGSATAAELAKLEQISPQSMGATVAALEARGLLLRRADPQDGRRVLLSPSVKGRRLLHDRRNAKAKQLAAALDQGFTAEELAQIRAVVPLLERLAHGL